ncbi:MAG TPA: CARDB domain-containing protein, partial [Candidatus Saccharimonadales bacterium]|nr:CARDB domain-containing protein [Candidatus Saccharimonadales bacterium]
MRHHLRLRLALAPAAALTLGCLCGPAQAASSWGTGMPWSNPEVSIYDINQHHDTVGYPAAGDTVQITGKIVVAIDTKPTTYGVYVMEPGGGAYGGLLIYTGADNPVNLLGLRVGDIITTQGLYANFGTGGFTLPEINTGKGAGAGFPFQMTITGRTTPPAPVRLVTGSLRVTDTCASPWTGVLCRLDSVYVTGLGAGISGQAVLKQIDSSNTPPACMGTGLDTARVNPKLISPSPTWTPGTLIRTLVGVVSREFQFYHIAPRDLSNDVHYLGDAPPPDLVQAYPVDATHVVAGFDRKVDPATATDPGNYSMLHSSLGTSGVLSTDSLSVTFATDAPMTGGAAETLSVAGVKGVPPNGTTLVGTQRKGFLAGLTPIVYVQTPDLGGDASQVVGELVTVQGVVTAGSNTFGAGAVFIGETDSMGVYRGLETYSPPIAVNIGDNVTMTGTVQEYNGKTEISNIFRAVINSSGNPVPPAVPVEARYLSNYQRVSAEDYEDVLVSTTGVVGVGSCSDSTVSFTVVSGSDTVHVGRLGNYRYVPCPGQTVHVRGIFDYTSAHGFTLEPRASSDLQAMITATAGPDGSISPSGEVLVNVGDSLQFTITPADCHRISTVLVDGDTVGPVSSYTFHNITTDHTISASFALITYTITASGSGPGSVSPSGAVPVPCAGSQQFYVRPDAGCVLVSLYADGFTAALAPDSSYTFTNVTQNHTLAATFALAPKGWGTGGDSSLAEPTIYDINQHHDTPGYPAERDTVRLTGKVVVGVDAKASTYGVYVMEPGGGPYSGLLIYSGGDNPTNLVGVKVGDIITTQGLFQIVGVPGYQPLMLATGKGKSGSPFYPFVMSITGHTTPPSPVRLVTGSLRATDTCASPWTGVLCELDSVYVTGYNAVYSGQALVKQIDSSHAPPSCMGAGLDTARVNPKFVWPNPAWTPGSQIRKLVGVVSREFQYYYIAPRDLSNDVQGMIDTIPPNTFFIAGPPDSGCMDAVRIDFIWSGTDNVSPISALRYRYRLDGGEWSVLDTVTAVHTGITEGRHTLTVYAVDEAGNADPTPATRSFTVDTTPPVAGVPAGQLLDAGLIRFAYTATDVNPLQGFHVQVAQDTAFGSPALDTTIAAAGQMTFAGTPGHIYYTRARATDCAGNQSPYSRASNGVSVPMLPDLRVTWVSSLESARCGAPVTVSWTVADSGAGSTFAPSWQDLVYLSPSSTFDSSTALLLGQFDRATPLRSGESYTVTRTVTIPTQLQGTFYLVVRTDPQDQQPETSGTNNSGASGGFPVSPLTLAELHPVSVGAVPSATAGGPLSVSWSVLNGGSGATDADHWRDVVFLSPGTVLDLAFPAPGQVKVLDTYLGSAEHAGALIAGNTYPGQLTVTLPNGISGTYYAFVYADLNATSDQQVAGVIGNVFEGSQELNNFTRSNPISVSAQLPANLVVDSLSAPAAAQSGQAVTLRWRVSNVGAAAPLATTWADRVYLSADTVLSPASDVLLGTFVRSGGLALDSSYVVQAQVTLPPDVSGFFQLFVQTDADSVVYETGRLDDVGAAPIQVTQAPWPDLRVVSTAAPDSGVGGGSVNVLWVVQNAGDGWATGTGWTDAVYLGNGPTWDRPTAVRLGGVWHADPLFWGHSYSGALGVTLPVVDAPATRYLFVVTDADSQLAEPGGEGNNVSAGRAIHVAAVAAGPGGPPLSPPEVVSTLLRPDLEVTSLSSSGSPVSGQPLEVAWSVRNAGLGLPWNPNWAEDVYLSADSVLDPETDLRLLRTYHQAGLVPGQSYSRDLSVTLPNGISGSYRLIVAVDSAGWSGDSLVSNNVRVSPAPLSVAATPPPDLRADSLTLPANATAGQPVLVHWRVVNHGSGGTVPGHWVDALYLSTDDRLDLGDVVLGRFPSADSLGPGGSYTQDRVVGIPAYASGSYNVILKADDQGEVYEADQEGNNTGLQPLTVELPLPADLVVRNVEVQPEAAPGGALDVSWDLANVGANPAVGVLTDAVYVSADTTLDATDLLVTAATHTVNLASGKAMRLSRRVGLDQAQGSASSGITGVLPTVAPGAYHALVRANIGNNVRELDLDNNVGFSAATFEAAVPALDSLTGEVSDSLSPGESRYYRVDVAAGQDLSVAVQATPPGSVNELYVSRGSPPTPASFDYSGPVEFTSAPSLAVPSTQAGWYYILVLARSVPAGMGREPFTLSATTASFSVTSITPDVGGTLGGTLAWRVSTELRGARFRPDTKVYLKLSPTNLLCADTVVFENSTRLRVRWDLRPVFSLPLPDTFDVVAVNQDGPSQTQAVLADGFRVEPGGALRLVTTMVKQDKVRKHGWGFYTFKYQNVSNRDIPILKVRLLYPTSSTLQTLVKSSGLVARSDLAPGAFSAGAGDAYLVTNETLASTLGVVDLLAHDVSPGAELSCTLGFQEFASSRFSVRSLASACEVSDFLVAEAGRIEAFRGQLLAGSLSGIPASVPPLANDWRVFRDSVLARTFVRTGVVGAADFAAFTAKWDTTFLSPSGPVPPPAGGTCVLPVDLPECEPDMSAAASALPSCVACFSAPLEQTYLFPEPVTVAVPGPTCDGAVDLTADASVVNSCDPNALAGPLGYGDQHWVSAGQTLYYTVFFENEASKASAAAQTVSVTQALDPCLDWTTVRFRHINIGGYTFDVPATAVGGWGPSGWASSLQLPAVPGVRAQVSAGVNPQTRVISWQFSSLDPLGAPLADPSLGFLPVNDVNGRGQGWVDFEVRPLASTASGAPLVSKASIVFDGNRPVNTVQLLNHVDSGSPTSQMISSITALDTATFVLGWAGQDDAAGSGVASYSVYVRTDAPPFKLLSADVSGTQAVATLPRGHTYSFYSLAKDHTGNEEACKAGPEVSIYLDPVGGVHPIAGLPAAFALHPNVPNPFTRSTWIGFDLPRACAVSLHIYDVGGRRVKAVLDRQRFQPGRYSVPVDVRGLASGV